MSTRLELFGKNTHKTKYSLKNIIAESVQTIPLIWFALFSRDDFTAGSEEELVLFTLTTSTKSALERLPTNVEALERIVGSKGECAYAAKLLSEAIVESGHRYVSINLLDLQSIYDDDKKFETHMIGAFIELKNCKGFNRLGGLSAVDDYKSIKLSKPAMTGDDWTNKDEMALDLLLGYPAVQNSRWHKLVLATAKKQRKYFGP